MNRLVAAEPLEAPFLEHAQQLGLRDDRKVANLVQEQRAFIGQFEPAGLAIVRAGKGALFVSEDFRLEQRVRQRRAVDRLELGCLPAAQLVNHPRHQLFARAGRSEDQHGDVGLRGRPDPLEDDQHLLVAPDHFAEALDGRRLVFGADRGAPLQETVEQLLDARVLRTRNGVARRRSGHGTGDAEADELADAILDVHSEPAERLHQRVGVEAFLRPGAEITEDAGAERALHQVPEPGVEIALGFGAGGRVPGEQKMSNRPQNGYRSHYRTLLAGTTVGSGVRVRGFRFRIRVEFGTRGLYRNAEPSRLSGCGNTPSDTVR